MSHEKELIASYLDDSLTARQVEELQEWLQADAENMRQFVLASAREEQLREAVMSSATLEALAVEGASYPNARRQTVRSRNTLFCAAMLVLVTATFWLVADRQPAHAFVTIVRTNGSVRFQNDDGTEMNSLRVGDQLAGGTFVVEGDSSQAEFTFEDQSTITLSGTSELTLRIPERKQLHLRRGVLLASVSPQPAGQSLRIRTPTAEAVVLGTSFAMNAEQDETFLRVSSGTVELHRLADDQSLKVSEKEQVRASAHADQPLLSERVSPLPNRWRANRESQAVNDWIGQWQDGNILAAVARTVFIKELGVHESHYHAGATNGFPGLVTLHQSSAIRIRYRTQQSLNIGLFVVTHTDSGMFSGNFETWIQHRTTTPDVDGWRTSTVPVESFHPIQGGVKSFQPGCIASSIFATTYDRDVGLEIAELEVISIEEKQ